MNYIMKKPTPPSGYRMLVEGQDMAMPQDLIWIMSNDGKSHHWTHCIKQTDEGIRLSSDTAKLYSEPKRVEDYCFFRCRKSGLQK